MIAQARRVAWVAVLTALAVLGGAQSQAASPADELMLRARVTAVTPNRFVRIHWRWGGEGLGGRPVMGELTAVPAGVTSLPAGMRKGRDYIVEKTKGGDALWLKPGVWTFPTPFSAFRSRPRRLFLTLTFWVRDPGGKASERVRGIEMEFEVFQKGRKPRPLT